ncbi:multidrug ABC transporter ATP-binding protein [Cnuibacter physcomitrellae]|uniref:Multidrug ABC transporter ATP-binding protein n=1 Tax=Cnuibacter physcomitrellae TaxID=1619308 RepID=A0A1X9LKQ8_9MICO|nr:ABC transporter ATP-binding protein [Cnuibacter physcomitrellae]ARJ05795.1 multidrug ABC transporter ATP-binding protein [Cnuibacter physcomitrellae]GGI36506.1 multidrug ABC transporter ATP-binding protein [Cnuibacter physcomitrellae]
MSIVVSGLARSFGDVQAVRQVSFEAAPGRVTALIGPNGSGKTTLMLMLATLLRPDAGWMRVAGVDPIADPRAARPLIGWMPDALGSWNNLTVRAVLEVSARMYGRSRLDAVERAAVVLSAVGLDELAGRPTRVLSRGQKQKLSLARALINDPAVLLLDEPASGLDPGARIELRELVLELASLGRTVLISSHVLAELDEMADDAVYLDRGVTASAERVQAARTSAREWRIRVLEAPGAPDLAGSLAALGVHPQRVRRDDRDWLVLVDSEADAATLLADLVQTGVRMTSFAPAVGDLEHTLLDIRERGIA